MSRQNGTVSQQDGKAPGRPEQDYLRQRLRYEREKRGWSRAQLSKVLQNFRCDLSEQVLHNMEEPSPGRPPRRVTVDELAAFAELYELTLEDLLKPPHIAMADEVASLLESLGAHQRALLRAWQGLSDDVRQLMLLVPTGWMTARTLEAMAGAEQNLRKVIDPVLDLEDALRSGDVIPLATPDRPRASPPGDRRTTKKN